MNGIIVVDGKKETNTGILLFMCYFNDKGRVPGRQPGALNSVFTSQIRHNVHKRFRAMRWWCSPSSSNSSEKIRNGCSTLCCKLIDKLGHIASYADNLTFTNMYGMCLYDEEFDSTLRVVRHTIRLHSSPVRRRLVIRGQK